MATLATWGAFAFDEKEITSFTWTTAKTSYIQVPRITGYPAVQQVGDTLGKADIGLKFYGNTAKARLNALRSFGIGTVALLTIDTTPLGNCYQGDLKINYEMLINADMVIISATLELEQFA